MAGAPGGSSLGSVGAYVSDDISVSSDEDGAGQLPPPGADTAWLTAAPVSAGTGGRPPRPAPSAGSTGSTSPVVGGRGLQRRTPTALDGLHSPPSQVANGGSTGGSPVRRVALSALGASGRSLPASGRPVDLRTMARSLSNAAEILARPGGAGGVAATMPAPRRAGALGSSRRLLVSPPAVPPAAGAGAHLPPHVRAALARRAAAAAAAAAPPSAVSHASRAALHSSVQARMRALSERHSRGSVSSISSAEDSGVTPRPAFPRTGSAPRTGVMPTRAPALHATRSEPGMRARGGVIPAAAAAALAAPAHAGGRSSGSAGSPPAASGAGGEAAPPSGPLTKPSIAPGSEVEWALTTAPKPAGRKLHRPKIVKKMALGTKEYYKQKEDKLQGNAIHRQHQFYHLSYGMMVGIYTSVVSVPSGSKLSLGDFMEVRKLEFPPGGSPDTQPHQLKETFKMKDYAPKVFHQLRERFGIDRKEYLSSLGGAYQYIEFHSNSKSGQFFFFSHDGKFMIKTQTPEESKFLRRILLHYFKHCAQNPGTYLPRFYGMHRLKMKHLGNRKVHFIVMHSVFDSGDLPIHAMYDLKGSTIGRAAKPEEKARGPGKVVLKDLDLMEEGVKLKLGATRRAAFLEQLKRDAAWLCAQQIMDYSLLLGIRNRHQPHVAGVKRMSVFVRAGGEAEGEGEGGGLADAAAAAVAELRAEGAYPDSDEEGGAAAGAGGGGGGGVDFSARTLPVGESGESSDSAGGAPPPAAARPRRGVTFGGPPEPATPQLRVGSPPVGPARRIPTVMSARGPVAPADQFTTADLEFFPASCDAVPGMEDGGVAEEVYYIGIIDVLQQYNFRKSGENLIKGFTHDRAEISAVSPKNYAERFVRFMAENSV